MRLGELAFTSHIYRHMIDNKREHENFLRENGPLDIGRSDHRNSLLGLLRKWGMRNARDADTEASEQLRVWYKQYGGRLPANNADLWDLQDADLQIIKEAYEDICSEIRGFGDTGAAKILYALKPKALLRWDAAIREQLQADDRIGGNSPGELYISFIKYVIRRDIPELQCDCHGAGFKLTELQGELEVPSDTIPKLIDGYYWLTITKGLTLPDAANLRKWAQWLEL